ncbi:MAG TPA: helix-turn-helix transcriptional regulator [Thermoanaerobaculia bacterium]|nr:helix-turn-helix transcriptional regulator [Thermoanaerobaculia bacterium]
MPDFTFEVNPRWSRLPECSAVLNSFPRDYVVHDYRTTLSIKTVARGAAWYHTAAGHYWVDEESFLLLNHDQTYSMEVAAATGTETLCPFFQRGFLEHAALALATPADRLLDEIEPPPGVVGFCERLYPKRGPVALCLAAIREAVRQGPVPAVWLEDRFFTLAEALLRLDREVRAEIAGFPGTRPSTRAELYRRLYRGRDLLASCYDQPLTVAMAARAAHLSPFHFQRMWKLAFGETPMQFLQARRLAVAQKLLATTEEDVTQIALAVGFESLGSFSWLFRRRFGVSPRGFRSGERPQ